MRGDFGLSFQGGAAQVHVNLERQLGHVSVRWPSSWTSLEALARTRGLRDKPGNRRLRWQRRLIGSLGSVDAIRWLATAR